MKQSLYLNQSKQFQFCVIMILRQLPIFSFVLIETLVDKFTKKNEF